MKTRIGPFPIPPSHLTTGRGRSVDDYKLIPTNEYVKPYFEIPIQGWKTINQNKESDDETEKTETDFPEQK